jgi:hypothetical protein
MGMVILHNSHIETTQPKKVYQMFTVYMNKKGVMVKQVQGEYYAVFTHNGSKHICDRSSLDDAIKIADSL